MAPNKAPPNSSLKIPITTLTNEAQNINLHPLICLFINGDTAIARIAAGTNINISISQNLGPKP